MRFLLLALVMVSTSLLGQPQRSINYFWLTNWETSSTFPGDSPYYFFRDTLWGPTRTNDCFRFRFYFGDPVAYDVVIQGCDSLTWHGSHPIPENFIYNAPDVYMPELLMHYREAATQAGTYLREPGERWYCSIRDTTAFLLHCPEGLPYDTTTGFDIAIDLSPRAVIFVDGELDLRGEMAAQGCELLLGCSQDIRLIDNVMLEGTDMNTGSLLAGATSRIAIASEKWISIANTVENGRENCGGGSHGPNAHDSCHVVITALLFSMRGEFTFEQQNDVNDPFHGPTPDERGNLVLTGGVTQWHRGYVHRSNNSGTGYNKRYRYDERLRYWRAGVLEPFMMPDDDEISWDAREPLFPAQFTLAVSPNPFNANTTIRYTLPEASHVRAVVYDVAGRAVTELMDNHTTAGSHTLQFDGANLSSGVYFLRFTAGEQISTHKLLLIK